MINTFKCFARQFSVVMGLEAIALFQPLNAYLPRDHDHE